MNETEDHSPHWARRRFLVTVGVAAAGTVAISAAAAPAEATPGDGHPASTDRPRTMWGRASSENGWPVVTSNAAPVHRIEGSNATVTLLPGAVATVLLYVARRFHYEIDELTHESVIGHLTGRGILAPYESNHLSGTAIAIMPNRFPTDARGGLFPHELAVVRDILTECEGVVRWGGDHRGHPKEGHFQIDVRPSDARLRQLARRVRQREDTPGRGAGSPIDVFSPTRQQAAKALAARQGAAG
ncbi:M15 family metallopeptidase [Micromonospora cathayae]|uniref:Uncharacterized protein n=1 Tax=Micromonospora cathayae TaxID=3028804 RepID=A0ABY7ZUN6_9ACTN|nr:M15 family metallopeptidase [Micromonospora sp. HUAS 3]WDZ86767.1 hypothetical protein PVK37_10405 [Micromonospora sp. HUAS 3]